MTRNEVTQKLEFYKKNNTKIHIQLQNKRFYNGFIKEIGSDFIVLNDSVLGEIIFFISEIDDNIEPYKEESNE